MILKGKFSENISHTWKHSHIYFHFHVALGLFTATEMFIQYLNNIWITGIAQYVD